MGKTLKVKGFIMNWTQDLFGMDCIESFNLLNQPINSFCYGVNVNSNCVGKLIKELIKFPEITLEGLGRCTKAKATFKIKENVMNILRPKKKVPFAAEASINKDLDSVEKIGMLTKWASPTV